MKYAIPGAAPSTTAQRIAGMLIYVLLLLFFLWYWPPSPNERISLMFWPHASTGSLAGDFLSSTFTDNASDEYTLQENLWLYTQLIAPVSAWLLRAYLGALLAKMHRAV